MGMMEVITLPCAATSDQRQAARREIVRQMEQGMTATEARLTSSVPMHRTTIYRLLKRVKREGKQALAERRHGYSTKLRGELLTWMLDYCQKNHRTSSSADVQRHLSERFNFSVSISQLNRVRAAHGLSRQTPLRDQHLTVGLPAILSRYEQVEKQRQIKQIIVDREGMAVEFLASLQAVGRKVVTVLRTDQYRDLTSFTDVGAFVPFSMDQEGCVIREVAPARIALPRPEHPGEVLSLYVVLIRDLRRMVAVQLEPEESAKPQPKRKVDRKSDECWWTRFYRLFSQGKEGKT